MGSTIDQDSSHVSTTKSDMGAKMLEAGAVLGTFGSVGSSAIAIYQFLQSLEDDPVQNALAELLSKIAVVLTKEDMKQLTDISNFYVRPLATQIDVAANASTSFMNSESAANRDTLSSNFAKGASLHGGLLGLLAGYETWFIPSAYRTGGKSPGWAKGRYSQYWCYSSGQFVTNGPWQTYVPLEQPPADEWSVPGPLRQTERRWDVGLCVPLMYLALRIWEAAMVQLEPFYRLTGQWGDHILTVADKMDSLLQNWTGSLLWTREMPAKSEIEQAYVFFVEPSKYYSSGSGFIKWPLGVLDPITGTERVDVSWWKADQQEHVVELWTEEQRGQFVKRRDVESFQLEFDCGLYDMRLRAGAVRNLRLPPPFSPSLEPHPELLHSKYSSSSSPGAVEPSQPVMVTDKAGKQWPGYYHRSSVVVTAPFSVQSNPAPGGDEPPRAESSVELGYEVKVTPTGGDVQDQTWTWQLRHHPFEPVSSLYHAENGQLRTIPYSITKEFKAPAQTWQTITDGRHRDKWDVRSPDQGETVAFTMTITVADMNPLDEMQPPVIPGDAEGLVRRGALWITIEANRNENHNRSFGVQVEVTETAAVDAKGNTKQINPKEFTDNKRYRRTLEIPVDICRIMVPSEFFDALKDALDDLQKDSKALGLPRPGPDPDPILELSLWRIILEKEPLLLQSYVHRLRESSRRPGLTAQQALAELDRTISRRAEPEVSHST